MHPSDILALRMKDIVPPFVPLLPCWSIVIAATEARGVATKTSVSDGSVFMDQRCFQWVSKLILGGENLEFRLFCSSMDVQDCNRHFETQRHDNVPNAPQWSQHRSGARFQNSARSANTRSVGSVQQCHKIRHKRSSGGPLPLSLAPSPRKVGNTHATCRGFVDNATASLAAHKCMAWNICLTCAVDLAS